MRGAGRARPSRRASGGWPSGRRRCRRRSRPSWSGSGRPSRRRARCAPTRRSPAWPSRCCCRSPRTWPTTSPTSGAARTPPTDRPVARRRGRPASPSASSRSRSAVVIGLAGVVGLYLVIVGGPVLLAVGLLRDRRRARLHGRAVAVRLPRPGRGVRVHVLRARRGRRDRLPADAAAVEPLYWVAAVPVGGAHHGHPRRQQPARHPDGRGRRQADAGGDVRASSGRAGRVRWRCCVVASRCRSCSWSPGRGLPVLAAAARGPARPSPLLGPSDHRPAPAQPGAQGTARLALVYAAAVRGGAGGGRRDRMRSPSRQSPPREAIRVPAAVPDGGRACGSSAMPGSCGS